jgi:hypothetical protein
MESWRMLCRRQLLFGPLSDRCFVAKSVLARFLADTLPPWSLSSLADALPPLLLDARSPSGYFATAAWSFAKGTIALLLFLLQAQL